MRKALVLSMIALLAGSMVFFSTSNAQQQPDQGDQGVEVQTRGPVHEAYAAPQSLDIKPSPIVPKQPPDPIEEMPPDQKPDGSQVIWISGYWAWDEEHAQYLWVSGFWRDVPPGRRWVPGHWQPVDNGWQWVSGLWMDQQATQVNYVPPPPPTLETGPSTPAPQVDQFYTPGTWIYVERKYRWRPGFWIGHRPDWLYVPACYTWTPAGCVFVDGYWDYALTRRGLLFSPIRLTAAIRPGWRFTPRFIVYPEVILSSLFVRAEYHRYVFGDYYGPKWVQHGYIPWVDYHLHAKVPEPFFAQYSWGFRKEANWERDFRKLYDDRRLGVAPRPPRTMALQTQYMRDLAEHKAIKVADKNFAIANVKEAERHLMMVNTLAKIDHKEFPLKTLTPAARAEVVKTIEHHAEVKVERKVIETKIIKETPPLRPSDVHQVGKLPVVPKHLEAPPKMVVPVRPVVPPHVEKVVPKYEPPHPVHASPKPLKIGMREVEPQYRAQHEWLPTERAVFRQAALTMM